jgi:two-component system, OmpR family, phosphate regulon sensor histidine kinase PhoR
MFGLRARMVVTAVVASAAALVLVLVLVESAVRGRAMDATRDLLMAEARLMAHVVEGPLAAGASPAELDSLVDRAAREVRARVTIITPDGRVLADSAASGRELLALENHRDRPEILAATATGAGTAVRRSTTVGEDLLYAAVAVRQGGRLLGVSRVALSLRGVQEQAAHLRRSLALALAVAFAITAALSLALSSSLAGPLAEVMDSARRFAAGDLGARARVRRGDEIGELARILNHSADQLQARLTEIARDRGRTDAILSAVEDGLLAVDHRGVVIMANPTLCRSLGLNDPVGRHYLEVIRQTEVGQVLEEVLRTGRRREMEVTLRHLRRGYALTGAPFPGVEGTPPGAVLTFHDVTERRRVDQIRRDFVANASHELRTPLTSIRGFVEALEDGALSDGAHAGRFLGKIRTHADRMAALVADLLELSRLEAGERPPQWETVSPADVLEEVVASLAGLAQTKEMVLTQGAAGAPPVVTDEDRLRRILENLLENALKYTPTGGHVEVRARRGDAGGVLFEVEDDGPGIAAEHLPRIFERFYRVDKARSRELGGTGLGLSIVKHLAEGMGATVGVRSEPGRGTCFSVAVPARPAGAAPHA